MKIPSLQEIVNCDPYISGQYVAITVTGNKALSVCELEVYSAGIMSNESIRCSQMHHRKILL